MMDQYAFERLTQLCRIQCIKRNGKEGSAKLYTVCDPLAASEHRLVIIYELSTKRVSDDMVLIPYAFGSLVVTGSS